MHIDLISLVKDALVHARCSDRLTEELDPHAPVELHFGSSLMMRVGQADDGAVELLAQLSEEPGVPSNFAGVAVVEALAQPASWAAHGCVSLLEMDGFLHLHAIVRPELLRDGEGLSSALAGFYDRLLLVHEAFNK